jgi:ribosomal protein S18 acetylase RimI-like enzyme
LKIRIAGREDAEFLHQMFLGAFFWRGDAPSRLDDDVIAAMAPYVSGWGRPGDSAVVAISDSGERLGAAWYRMFTSSKPGYGFVGPEIPELGIAVAAAHQDLGVGRRLMNGLIELAVAEGHPGMSLSVEDGNSPAAHLYESVGFRTVGRNGNARTMLLELKAGA